MKLLTIDGNSVLNRAFYGIKLLTTKGGIYTNGIYGFLSILLRVLEETVPDRVAVAFDKKGPTFRHQQFDGYKAGRKGMPPELAGQLPVLKELLADLGYAVVECEGYEADDILGTLSRACQQQGGQCVIATGDRDALQLVTEQVQVRLATTKMGRPESTLYDVAAILEKYTVLPEQLIDVKALMGDSSDNIPGVAGIGEKTALALIRDFHDLDNLYAHLDDPAIRPAVRQKLEKDRETAYMSRDLARIRLDAPGANQDGRLFDAAAGRGKSSENTQSAGDVFYDYPSGTASRREKNPVRPGRGLPGGSVRAGGGGSRRRRAAVFVLG